MNVHRCAVLFFQIDDGPRFSLSSLLSGGDGLDCAPRLQVHAPHMAEPRAVDLPELRVLMQLGRDEVVDRRSLEEKHGVELIQRLVNAGLLVSSAGGSEEITRVDEAARSIPWWPQALLAQVDGGWSGIDVQANENAGLSQSIEDALDEHGPPPSHDCYRSASAAAIELPRPDCAEFDRLLAKRRTCRNFAGDEWLSIQQFAQMMYRVWGAVGSLDLAPGVVIQKKSSPSGGGLHAVEAYLLIQRVDGLAPGIYHYLAHDHALESLRELPAAEAATLAHRFVAGQHWFANVPVMVIMVCRFDRLFWKYRRHSKAWRVAHLDIGHLSQTMYLSAADLGLGAFVTAAINDRDVDAELGLPPLREASIAIVGFGPRAAEKVNPELDDLTPTPASRR